MRAGLVGEGRQLRDVPGNRGRPGLLQPRVAGAGAGGARRGGAGAPGGGFGGTAGPPPPRKGWRGGGWVGFGEAQFLRPVSARGVARTGESSRRRRTRDPPRATEAVCV